MMRQELMAITDRLDRMERDARQRHPRTAPPRFAPNPPRRNQPRRAENEDDEVFGEDELADDLDRISLESRQGDEYNEGRRERNRFDRGFDNMGNIKMKIPEFRGRSDPDEYLDWERKMERVFDCHEYSERKKVKLAAIEFTEYAVVWWDKLCISRKYGGIAPIDNWGEMN